MTPRATLVAPVAILVVASVLSGCAGDSTTPTTTLSVTALPTPTPSATASATTRPSDAASTVMTALCEVEAQPTANAAAGAAFFSVHDTLHELAAQLDAKEKRDLSARLLQATAAVEAHVEDTSTSVPWPQATAALVAVVPTAYAALGITAPACG